MLRPEVSIKSSQILSVLFGIIYCGALSLIVIIDLPALLRGCIFILCGFYGIWVIGYYALCQFPTSIIKIEESPHEYWLLTQRDGELLKAQLDLNSLSTPFLSCLNFKLIDKKGRRSVLITRDNADRNKFRQLRAWLNTLVY